MKQTELSGDRIFWPNRHWSIKVHHSNKKVYSDSDITLAIAAIVTNPDRVFRTTLAWPTIRVPCNLDLYSLAVVSVSLEGVGQIPSK